MILYESLYQGGFLSMNKRVLWIILGAFAVIAAMVLSAFAGGAITYLLQRFAPVEALAAERVVPEADQGILVAGVEPGSPAEEAGIVRGDIIMEIDDEEVNSALDFNQMLKELQANKEVALTVLHGDVERIFNVELTERDGIPYLGIRPCGISFPGFLSPGSIMPGSIIHEGALITEVTPDSPADASGLQAGDQILSVDGQDVGLESGLGDLISAYEPGDQVSLEVKSADGETRQVTVTLGEHPEEDGLAYLGVFYKPGGMFRFKEKRIPFGEPLEPGDEGLMPFFEFGIPGKGMPLEKLEGLASGAVIREVVENSPGETAGLQVGDVITEVNDDPISSPDDLVEIVSSSKPGDEITLTVVRESEEELGIDLVLGEHPDDPDKAYLGITIEVFFKIDIEVEGEDGSSFDFPLPDNFFENLPYKDLLPEILPELLPDSDA
jgi:S1-C subfamily serine protease